METPDNKNLLADRGMADFAGLQQHLFLHSHSSKVTEISEIHFQGLPYQFKALHFGLSTVHLCGQRGYIDGASQGSISLKDLN